MALRVENISKIFDSKAGRFVALRRINLKIKKGGICVLVGPSGSGKSTLLNIIGALDRPSHGRLFINNVDVFFFKQQMDCTNSKRLYRFHLSVFQSNK
jgi:putative ABC transport system ATP-binding protein